MRDLGARDGSGISRAGRQLDGMALAFETGMTVNDQALHGRVVLSGDGVAIGEITRLNVEPTTWYVLSIEVKVRKDAAERIGVHRSMFHAPTIVIPTEHVQSVGDAVILSIPIAALRQEPEHEPAPAPAH